MSKPQTARSISDIASHAEIVQRGWEAVARGDWDALIADYTANMVFVMPGQADMLHGKAAFRSALDNIGAALPPGFNITAMRQIADGERRRLGHRLEKPTNAQQGSQLAVLFRFAGDKVCEERWFIDTEQWKSAF